MLCNLTNREKVWYVEEGLAEGTQRLGTTMGCQVEGDERQVSLVLCASVRAGTMGVGARVLGALGARLLGH